MGRVWVAGGGEVNGGEGRKEGGDGGPVCGEVAGEVGEASRVRAVYAKAAMRPWMVAHIHGLSLSGAGRAGRGQSINLKGAVGLVG